MKRPIPSWLNAAVFYEIYPQSFYDSNGDGIGDLPGIIEKLDYVKSLGCNAIWLNPCFESPFGDAGYDVSDFYKIAPRYGTNADAKRLFREAKKRGLRVVLDLVAGHTSAEHPWFKASSSPLPNQYSNWYIWTDSVWTAAPPGMTAVNGYSERDGNYVTNFFHFQPALNYGFAKPDPKQNWQLPPDHPDVQAVRQEMRKIMEFWLAQGADGFRVDMAASLIKLDKTGKATCEFWQGVRKWFDEKYPEAVLISEWSIPEVAIRAGFHVDFMIHFATKAYTALFRQHTDPHKVEAGESIFDRKGQRDVRDFLDEYWHHYRATRKTGFISMPTGNHDMVRIRKSRDFDDLKVVYAFLLTMPGVPFIYYGDEIGMQNIEGLVSKEGAYSRTGARTPMQWSAQPNAGFSSAAPAQLYLPIDPSATRPNVAAQEKDGDSLLNFIRKLTQLRHEHPALQGEGKFVPLSPERRKLPLVYLRKHEGQKFLVALNPSGERVKLKVAKLDESFVPVLRKGAGLTRKKHGVEIELDPVSFGIFKN